MKIIEEYAVDDGNGTVIRLLGADADNGSGLRRGTCPGCHNGMEGYLGEAAAMVELDSTGEHVGQRKFVGSTNWGHEPCVEQLYRQTVTNIEHGVAELPWTASTQREMILFLQDNGSIEATYDSKRPAASRYHYRRKVSE